MTTAWKVRHEGSPRAIEGLTLPQVVEGLGDGLWEPTDEVQGPADRQWTAIESHPQLAEVAADIEPPPPAEHPDETRLDMNPLIDVALVLLIFFILTTTYETIHKVLDMPRATQEKQGPIRKVPESLIKERMIVVRAYPKDGAPVVEVERQPVPVENLVEEIRKHVSRDRNELLLDVSGGVEWGVVVAIQDAAKGAGVQKGHYLVKPPGK